MNRFHIFLTALLLTACAGSAAAPGPEAPTSADTAPRVEGEEVTYQVDGVTFTGYVARDVNQTGSRPGVIVVHEWWGHNDYVRERARQLAGLGYTAFALDMYGDGKLADHPDDAKTFMTEVLSNIAVGEARFRAAHALLAARNDTDAARIAAIGYCFGGAVVLHMARAGDDLRGVASFHGMLATETPAEKGAVKGRVFVATGADDPMVDAAQVDAFKQEMTAAGVTYDLVSYPGAKHGFTVPGATERGKQFGMPVAYNEAADRDSWTRLEAFLAQVLAD